MSIPSSTYHNPKRIPIPGVPHQLSHLFIACHWLPLLLLISLLPLLIIHVFLVYLAVEATVAPVIILRGEVVVGLDLPLVVGEDRPLLSCHDRHRVPQHTQPVQLSLAS
jgi:hypothetical protein